MYTKLSPVKKAILYSFILTAIISTCLSVHSVHAAPKTQTTAAPASDESSIITYYATVIGNYVVIYKDGDTEPMMTTDIDVRTLPEADKKLLNQGIILSDETAISNFLEDYGS